MSQQDPAKDGPSLGRMGDGVVTPLPIAGARENAEQAQAKAAAEPPKPDALLLCLARVSVLLGKQTSLAEIRSATPMPSGRMTVEDFVRAAHRLGYKVGRRAVTAEALAAMPLPFVILGKDGGAKVVTERRKDEFTLFDPNRANAETAKGSALLGWTEGALLVAPIADTGKGLANWRTLISNRLRAALIEIGVASLIINLFALGAPLFSMTVYNKVIGQQAFDTLTVLAIGMIFLYVFEAVLRAMRGYISSHSGARLDALIGSEVMHKLLHMPLNHFETTPTGMIAERLRQLETLRQFFTGATPMALADLAFVFIFVFAQFYIDVRMGVVLLVFMPLFVLMSYFTHKAQKKLLDQSFQAMAAKASVMTETANNSLTIKSLGLEPEIEKRWENELARTAWTGYRSAQLSNTLGSLGGVLQNVASLVIIVLGAQWAIAGEMTVGALIASSILTSRAIAPLRQVISTWNQVQELKAALERLDVIMNAPGEPEPGALGPAPRLAGAINLENVSYAYGEELPKVIEEITLAVKPGEVLGIVGPSGSGKSTLARIIQGLYKPVEGRALLDGTDVEHIAPAAARSQIGVVPQEVQLFAGTVRENIGMGLGPEAAERIVGAARFVGAHDFIMRLPKGYETQLAERGVGLSAGQRQLLCIARALARNPRILILDEATSALDPETEGSLLRNLKRAAEGRTILMITHRAAPLTICDRVIVITNGRITREGSPQDVLAPRAAPGPNNPPNPGAAP
ncbi:MAG TPA: peptidase domain-containing ABC transporter [Alphaproteobacteria bacterium]|nr:peptidase domain-containing ABC transporter [Alphaproteobacteria bacterium]